MILEFYCTMYNPLMNAMVISFKIVDSCAHSCSSMLGSDVQFKIIVLNQELYFYVSGFLFQHSLTTYSKLDNLQAEQITNV